jgi:hypothetical protein
MLPIRAGISATTIVPIRSTRVRGMRGVSLAATPFSEEAGLIVTVGDEEWGG